MRTAVRALLVCAVFAPVVVRADDVPTHPIAISSPIIHLPDASAAEVDVVSGAVGAVLPVEQPLAIEDVDRIVGAFGARDWQVALAALLGLVAYFARRFTPAWSWAHTRNGAIGIAVFLASVSAVIPLLTSHASWLACGLVAVVTALSALAAMARPIGNAQPRSTEAMDQALRLAGFNRARATDPASLPPPRTLAVAVLLLSGASVTMAGCAEALQRQPVALQRAERDAFGCALPAVQSAIQKYAPLTMDALGGEDVNWSAPLAPLAKEGVDALVCTVAHLLYDALGSDGVKAIAEVGLEQAVERRLLIADAGGLPLDGVSRRILRRGLSVLRTYVPAVTAP